MHSTPAHDNQHRDADVVVYITPTVSTSQCSSLSALLQPSEQNTLNTISHEGRYIEYLTGRLLCRHALSDMFAHIGPGEWEFTQGQYGKPEITRTPHGIGTLPRFNLSHTSGLLVCAILSPPSSLSPNAFREVGVDVEFLKRRSDIINVAGRYFAKSEMRQFEATPNHLKRLRFFQFWTLKEALIKAKGAGLHLPLSEFSFQLAYASPMPLRSPPEHIDISFSEKVRDENPKHWSFVLQPVDLALLKLAESDGNTPVVSAVDPRVIAPETMEPPHLIALALRHNHAVQEGKSTQSPHVQWKSWQP